MGESFVEIPLVNKESIADPANGWRCFLSIIVMGKPISGFTALIN